MSAEVGPPSPDVHSGAFRRVGSPTAARRVESTYSCQHSFQASGCSSRHLPGKPREVVGHVERSCRDCHCGRAQHQLPGVGAWAVRSIIPIVLLVIGIGIIASARTGQMGQNAMTIRM
jgi:hypothetical protein